jgi:NAD(P)H-dependent nitrite reductase small subunit
MAVSGCVRECAEAQSKDVGIIATEDGWNLYVCGNGGANPRHADLIATGIDDETAIRYIDRFFMYYLHTADRLQRTARWLEELDGGIEYLKRVVIEDNLGICEQLEKDMESLVSGYACEWKIVVDDAERSAAFRHYVHDRSPDESLRFVQERDQKRPEDWKEVEVPSELITAADESSVEWVRVASTGEVPRDGGTTVKYGDTQIALFHFAHSNRYFATQNVCPHKLDMVLSRGIVGDSDGIAKLACPLHKKTFALDSGRGISDPDLAIMTFPVEIRDGDVFIELPPKDSLAERFETSGLCRREQPC